MQNAGVLACLDGYMNIAMEQTEEYVDGQLKAKYGDCFIRGNNGTSDVSTLENLQIGTLQVRIFHTALLFHFADTFNDVHHSPHIRLDVFFKILRVLIKNGAATVLNHFAHLGILCGHSRCGAQALCHGVWRAAGDKQARPKSSVKLRG